MLEDNILKYSSFLSNVLEIIQMQTHTYIIIIISIE